MSSYAFAPTFVTVRQGDTVALTVFVINGDEHEVGIQDPQGHDAIPKTVWQRGREYQVPVLADKIGTYHVTCSTHAPTMGAAIVPTPGAIARFEADEQVQIALGRFRFCRRA